MRKNYKKLVVTLEVLAHKMKFKTALEMVEYMEKNLGIRRDSMIVTWNPETTDESYSQVIMVFDCIEEYNMFRLMFYYLPSPNTKIGRCFIEEYVVDEFDQDVMTGGFIIQEKDLHVFDF